MLTATPWARYGAPMLALTCWLCFSYLQCAAWFGRGAAQSFKQGSAAEGTGAMTGKTAVLAEGRVLYAGASRVVDPVFRSSTFFDPQDLVQVKYEMVRRVRVDGVAVSAATRAFGFSRNVFYTAAAALDEFGPAGLVPSRPGPKGARKLTDEVMVFLEARLAERKISARRLVAVVKAEFGLQVHPRSIERALARRREARDAEAAIGARGSRPATR